MAPNAATIVVCSLLAFQVPGPPRPPVSSSTPNGWYCVEGVGRTRRGAPSDNPLNESAALRVMVQDPDRLLAPGALDKVAAHFMAGVTVWRRVCAGCYPAGLIHITVNGQDYLNEAVASAIAVATPETQWRSGRPTLGQQVAGDKVITLDYLESQMAATLNPRGMQPAPMRRISRQDGLFRRLCGLTGSNTPAFIGRLQRDLNCRGDSPEDSGRPLTILLKNSNTSCGFSKNIIACEADPYLLEFNGRDFTFTDGKDGATLFGRGSSRLDVMHVLVHELGHWAGLGHLEAGSIMAAAMSDSTCIDAATTRALQSATMQPWVPPASAAFRMVRE